MVQKELAKHLSLSVRKLCPVGDAVLLLNTTHRVAKFMQRFGFSTTSIEKNGYGKGYDLVRMEKRIPHL